MMKKQSFVIVLILSIATARTDEGWNMNSDQQDYTVDDLSKDVLDPMQTDPRYTHFFNGSYGVHDVLKELLSNRSLTSTSSTTMQRSKRGDDCLYSRLYGGRGGSFFRDPCSPDNIGGIVIRSGGIIDAIQMVYTNNNDQQWIPTKHGGTGGKKRVIYFDQNQGEYLIAIVGSYGRTIWCRSCINELGFITENKDGMQVMHGPYGLKKGHLLMFVGQIGGFFGRSGQYLDAIGSYYAN